MSHITVKMKDGTSREFPHQHRAGGSYSNKIAYEIGFVVITDEFGKETAIPSEDIAEIIKTPPSYY